jgi:hypothetical protein
MASNTPKSPAPPPRRTATPPVNTPSSDTPYQIPQGPPYSSPGVSKGPAQPARAAAPASRIKVRATQPGYYGDARRREGDVFFIDGAVYPRDHEKAGQVMAFSDKWMERVDDSVPERTTTSAEALQAEHDRILGGKVAEASASRDESNPIGGD